MAWRKALLAGVGMLILPQAAISDDEFHFSGTVGGGETFYDAPNLHVGDWNANGSVLFTIYDPGFNLQANFTNDNLSAAAHGGDFWSYGGDAYWRDYAGAIGLNVTAHAISNFIQNGRGADFDSFGGFGQWYVAPEATLEFKTGWMTQHYEGPYAGVGFVGYPLDSVAVALNADYVKANYLQPELKDIGVTAEWLPLVEFPVSVGFGYTRAQITRLPHPPDPSTDRSLDIFSVAVKVYFGATGQGSTLRDYHRNGAVSYDSAPPAIVEFGY